jgi:hypothetical protein
MGRPTVRLDEFRGTARVACEQSGSVVLDEHGHAIVELSESFGALHRDFRYQLTSVGGFAPIFIAEEVNDGCFKIAGGRQGLKVLMAAHRYPSRALEADPPAARARDARGAGHGSFG